MLSCGGSLLVNGYIVPLRDDSIQVIASERQAMQNARG
jgi:hypothetical protein